MKPGGGKAKGANFEREVCKMLSKWVTRNMRDDLFWRSAMSGGRATIKKTGTKNITQTGDITSIDERGHKLMSLYSVECKHVKDLHLDQLYTSTVHATDGLSKFWRIQAGIAWKIDKSPIIIAKQNNFSAGILVCLNQKGKDGFSLKIKESLAYFPPHDLYIYSWENFARFAKRP